VFSDLWEERDFIGGEEGARNIIGHAETNLMVFFIFTVFILLRKYINNGTYIYRLRNNLFIHATCFDPNGSSSGASSYTSPAIELQH
jgi:hypothetical protein